MNKLKDLLKDKVFFDDVYCTLYSTDASIYRIKPIAVCFPETEEDVFKIIKYANENNVPIIPRGAGTSLAGQAVGEGIVVDNSRYFNKIIKLEPSDNYVIVNPGIVRGVLNNYLKKFNVFFPPETSTSNRCTIGGMIGNNSCGTRALVYGTTRDYVIEISGFFSNGDYATLKNILVNDKEELNKINYSGIVSFLYDILSDIDNQKKIKDNFPCEDLVRRNTGYAIDVLLNEYLNDGCVNIPKLIAGSEGTLFYITQVKLKLLNIQPLYTCLVCVHLKDFYECFDANLIALKYNPYAVELMDGAILKLALANPEQKENSFFVEGCPEAIIIVEFSCSTKEELDNKIHEFISELRSCNLGYHYPVIREEKMKQVWKLREAGLGVMSNLKGYAKPVSIIEDTCVNPKFLKSYIKEIDSYLKSVGLTTVYYGHISTGELHFKPALNLRDYDDVIKMKEITEYTVKLVKKYKGSISGEHGDGLLRSYFLSDFFGNEVYNLLRKIKYAFDPHNIFNPGKIVNGLTNDVNLRFDKSYKYFNFKSYFNNYDISFQNTIEKCNGSADCIKKTNEGNMCPTYRATFDEYYSTRGRANFLREMMQCNTFFKNKEVYKIITNCISCKACKIECPSNIDMTKFKSEYLQHYYDENGINIRNFIIASMPLLYKNLSIISPFFNYIVKNKIFSKLIKKTLAFSQKRKIPVINKIKYPKLDKTAGKNILFFLDEFSAYIDTDLAHKTIILLSKLEYNLILTKPLISGRTYLSKGFVRKSKDIINKNLRYFYDYFTEYNNDLLVVGIDPSVVVTYRDESLELCYPELKDFSILLAKNIFTIEEFLFREIKDKNITPKSWLNRNVHLHVHCYFKALSDKNIIKELLERFGYNVTMIEVPCCGMAGSFGFEKEHYELSHKIAEPLIEYINKVPIGDIICANGTSCRQQILDFTGRRVFHPIELLYNTLIVNRG